jgi:hypothetical protein
MVKGKDLRLVGITVIVRQMKNCFNVPYKCGTPESRLVACAFSADTSDIVKTVRIVFAVFSVIFYF